MKEFSAESAYSIETIQGNTIISKSGDLSVVYELIEPECYSLSEEDMQKRHEEYMRAFSHISYGYIHRQDIYLRDSFDGRDMPTDLSSVMRSLSISTIGKCLDTTPCLHSHAQV